MFQNLQPKRKHREVKLEWAAPLHDNLPAPELPPGTEPEDTDTEDTAQLPPGLPEDAGFTPAQRLLLSSWYRQMQLNLYDTARHILATAPAEGLLHYILNAVLLARALRLHPACEHSLSTLARALNVDKSDLAERSRAILRAMAGAHRHHATPRTLSIRELAANFPQLNFRAREGKLPVITVPFANQRTLLAEQFTTVTALAGVPGITATLDLTTAGFNAVRITFPSVTHNTNKTNMSTKNAIHDALCAHLSTTLTHARKGLLTAGYTLPLSTVNTLTGYLDALHTYATTRHGKADCTPKEENAAARHAYLLANHLQEHAPALEPVATALREILY